MTQETKSARRTAVAVARRELKWLKRHMPETSAEVQELDEVLKRHLKGNSHDQPVRGRKLV